MPTKIEKNKSITTCKGIGIGVAVVTERKPRFIDERYEMWMSEERFS